MPVTIEADRILLHHGKGASAEILVYGATVISWKSGSVARPKPVERLFVSSTAILDGSYPVRGGIPIIFPCFAAPTHPEHSKITQHGFARTEPWKWDSIVTDTDACVSVRLTLEPTPSILAMFDKPFHLAYVVTLAEHQLSTDLHVKNTSTDRPLEFQALFHSYIRAPSQDVLITPLQGTRFYDRTEASEEARNTPHMETRAAVDVKKFTGRVYEDPPLNYQVTWPGGRVDVKAVGLPNLVVWNPGRELADLETGGWEKFVCVEPGFVRGFANLDAGKTWIGQQVISVIE
ncbi:hypothetical protein PLICRDRAFT_178352 [Plicaturopsis crispa FD-325 SS-3]|nr:hypothetical protein PLICRDRAFT_178352 [Plicaturopsis crispa FD-325 SS-3]